jgi:hypothetical protein
MVPVQEKWAYMPQDTLALMDNLDNFLIQLVRHFPWDLFPWAAQLSLTDQRTFLLDVLQAIHQRDPERLHAGIEDWQATAESLKNIPFMKAFEQPYDPGDYVPWEQVRGERDVARDPEAGCS